MRPVYRREIITLPIPPAIREKLLTHGFRTVADLEGVGPMELSNGGVGKLSSWLGACE